MKQIKDLKYVTDRITDTNTKLNDIKLRLANPKVAAKMSQNGIETRLTVKLETLQQLESDLLSKSLLLRLLRFFRVV